MAGELEYISLKKKREVKFEINSTEKSLGKQKKHGLLVSSL